MKREYKTLGTFRGEKKGKIMKRRIRIQKIRKENQTTDQ